MYAALVPVPVLFYMLWNPPARIAGKQMAVCVSAGDNRRFASATHLL